MENIGQTYLRGQIWYARFPYDFKMEGREDSVVRPVLIISGDGLNKDNRSILVAPLTRQDTIKPSPLHIPCSYNRYKSTILMDNMKNVLKSDFSTYEFTLGEPFMALVDDAVLMATGLKEIPEETMVKGEKDDFDINHESNEDVSEFLKMVQPKTVSKTKTWSKDKKIEFVRDYENRDLDDSYDSYIRDKWNLDDDQDPRELYLKFAKAIS